MSSRLDLEEVQEREVITAADALRDINKKKNILRSSPNLSSSVNK